jgi:hypothetical protein
MPASDSKHSRDRPLLLTAGALRIEFVRQRDRFVHRIGLVVDDNFSPLLTSDEGDASWGNAAPNDHIRGEIDAAWPPSPPFQELRIESRDYGQQVALLVGMAGSSHWSASVETDPHAGSTIFDVACRLREPARTLGSRYRIAAGCQAELSGGEIRFEGTPGRRMSLTLDPAGIDNLFGLHLRAGMPTIEPAEAEPPAGVPMKARTIRWKYVFQAG